MKSPFPGMDPYLEEPNLWSDVHTTLIIAIKGALNAELPDNYVASADKYVWIHEPDAGSRTRVIRPDAFLVKHKEAATEGGPVVAPAPATIVLPAKRREGNKYLKIVDVNSRRLVTVVELLSPANKRPGPDRDDYLTKRIDYLTAGVNLVEIDLLRAGERLPLGDSLPGCFDYYVLVCRAPQMPAAGIWSFTVRDPIPRVSIPLSATEADVPLELRPCLDWAYHQGRYWKEVNYDVPPVPPLAEADAAWAQALLENKTAG